MFSAIWTSKTRLFAVLALLSAGPALAVECENARYQGNSYTTCTVDLNREELRLFLNDDMGAPYGQFSSIDRALADKDQQLAFATNGGMYHDDRRPVGHYVEDGMQIMRVVPNAGPGNFGLLPNGVLCIGQGWVRVIETLRFLEEQPACDHASQSGPMLVIDGALHPKFRADSSSRFIRNGVGSSTDGTKAVFVISNNSVTFHEFGSYFRDVLGIDQALFIDGNVSRLHAPSIGRSDGGRRLGPIVGVVEPITN